MHALKLFRLPPTKKVNLARIDPDFTGEFVDKIGAEAIVQANTQRLAELQARLYAENKRSLLVVLQGMDTSGKDGTIRHVMSGMNPLGVSVHSFKSPTHLELDHDYLWRVHHACPRRGEVAVFNRSHYEDILIARVRKLAPPQDIEKRYRQINDFERHLTENGTVILKCFLHISKQEQKERLVARLKDPLKNWKFEEGDLRERTLWNQYQHAYELALQRCGTPHAPWLVIPANKKWFRNLAVSQAMVLTLEAMKPAIPKPRVDLKHIVVR